MSNKAIDRALLLTKLLLSGNEYTRAEIYAQISAYGQIDERSDRLFERDIKQVDMVFPVVRTRGKPVKYSLK